MGQKIGISAITISHLPEISSAGMEKKILGKKIGGKVQNFQMMFWSTSPKNIPTFC